MMRIACVVMTLVASVASADNKPDELIKDQAAALKAMEKDKLVALFAKDAAFIGPQDVGTIDEDIVDTLFYPNPHANLTAVKVGAKQVGVRDGVAWLAFELVASYFGSEPELGSSKWKTTYWVTELAVKDGETWKIVAAHFGVPQKGEGVALDKIASTTKADKLATAVLASPESLALYLSKDPAATILGSDPSEKAFGNAAAKKLANSWKKLTWTVSNDVREVHGTAGKTAWGYVIANVDLPSGKKTIHMRALVIGILPASMPWEMVSAHFSLFKPR
jgi:hypothetical protein